MGYLGAASTDWPHLGSPWEALSPPGTVDSHHLLHLGSQHSVIEPLGRKEKSRPLEVRAAGDSPRRGAAWKTAEKRKAICWWLSTWEPLNINREQKACGREEQGGEGGARIRACRKTARFLWVLCVPPQRSDLALKISRLQLLSSAANTKSQSTHSRKSLCENKSKMASGSHGRKGGGTPRLVSYSPQI